MREQERFDARDQRDGGWSWVQNELYTFFLPIIGREAAWLYQVMAMLIPKRAMDPVFDLNTGVISKNSGMAAGSVSKNMNILIRAGMVERQQRGPNAAPLYVLTDLKKLIRLGDAELRKRLTAFHHVNGSRDVSAADTSAEEARNDAESGAERADLDSVEASRSDGDAASPATSDDAAVHDMNGSADLGAVEENLWKTGSEAGTPFTKPGVAVHETGGSRSRGEAPLIKKQSNQKPLNPPDPPQAGGGAVSSLAASAAPVTLTQLLLDPGMRRARSEAVAKVMRECGLAGMRYERAIESAMMAEAQRSDEPPEWNAIAERMTAAREEYSRLGRAGLLRFGPYGADNFFRGGVWRDDGLWGVNYDEMRRRGSARVGMSLST